MIYKRQFFNIVTAKKINDKKLCGQIETNGGLKTRILAWDCTSKDGYPIVAAVCDPNKYKERICFYSEEGVISDTTTDGRFRQLYLKLPLDYVDYSNYKPKKYESCLVKAHVNAFGSFAWFIAACAGYDKSNKPIFYENSDNGNEPNIFDSHQGYLPLNEDTLRLYGTIMDYEDLF